MKKIAKFFSEHLIMPLIVAILTPIATAIASYFGTGDWFQYFLAAPRIVWYSIGVLLLIWATVLLIVKRFRKIREYESPGIFRLMEPRWGQVEMVDIPHKNVVWTVIVPATAPWEPGSHLPLIPANLDVDTPPRCPNCNTELTEKKAFWGGYLWSCPNCTFKKRGPENFFTISDEVLRIARRHLREFLKQQRGGASA
jgi:ribosomal protein L37AE/L43A